jgi:hypothetical protein
VGRAGGKDRSGLGIQALVECRGRTDRAVPSRFLDEISCVGPVLTGVLLSEIGEDRGTTQLHPAAGGAISIS